jgi:hypothetical protein
MEEKLILNNLQFKTFQSLKGFFISLNQITFET